jgi:DNA-directed RNA polymerase specialized sigma24 family protein
VPSPEPSKKDWVLTKEAFDALLAALDENRERAAEQYEVLRHKLVNFFRWHGGAHPDELSDETLNVAARKLAEGEQIRSIPVYCLGIARNLLMDQARGRRREEAALGELLASGTPVPQPDQERLLESLEQCMLEIPEESRRLLLIYYGGEKRAKIEARKALAEQLGIPLNALRIRAWRLRARLAGAVAERTKSQSGP